MYLTTHLPDQRSTPAHQTPIPGGQGLKGSSIRCVDASAWSRQRNSGTVLSLGVSMADVLQLIQRAYTDFLAHGQPPSPDLLKLLVSKVLALEYVCCLAEVSCNQLMALIPVHCRC